jgi:hypothetical protein
VNALLHSEASRHQYSTIARRAQPQAGAARDPWPIGAGRDAIERAGANFRLPSLAARVVGGTFALRAFGRARPLHDYEAATLEMLAKLCLNGH